LSRRSAARPAVVEGAVVPAELVEATLDVGEEADTQTYVRLHVLGIRSD
jgi:hypothetical protein